MDDNSDARGPVDSLSHSSSIPQILTTLKRQYKARGLSYNDVARALKISEATVKRYMSGHGLTINVLERLIEILGFHLLDFLDVVRADDLGGAGTLSADQEAGMSDDAFLWGIFALLRRRWSIREIRDEFKLSEAEMTRFLMRLEKLELIELHPFDRVTFRTTRKLKARPGGPLPRMLQTTGLKEKFFNFDPTDSNVEWAFVYHKLSPHSLVQVGKMFDRLIEEMSELERLDHKLPSAATAWHGMLVIRQPFDLLESVRQGSGRGKNP